MRACPCLVARRTRASLLAVATLHDGCAGAVHAEDLHCCQSMCGACPWPSVPGPGRTSDASRSRGSMFFEPCVSLSDRRQRTPCTTGRGRRRHLPAWFLQFLFAPKIFRAAGGRTLPKHGHVHAELTALGRTSCREPGAFHRAIGGVSAHPSMRRRLHGGHAVPACVPSPTAESTRVRTRYTIT
jgi:hypothetical protein